MYDVIVIGLGGMGSAATYHLARPAAAGTPAGGGRPLRVLGLERHTPAHDRGSSHGRSRVIRQAYFEDPAYVPLLLRAYELWEALGHDAGRDLLTITGGLMMGAPMSEVVTGSAESARTHGLPHAMLGAAEIRRRFPPFNPGPDEVALYEPKAGVVEPEASVSAHLDGAARRGAELHFEEPIFGWDASPSGDGVTVRTTRGRYEAGRLVLASGPWAPDILAGLDLPLAVARQVMFWFDPLGGVDPYLPDRFPIYIWEPEAGGLPFYGFPALDGPRGGVKVAIHGGGEPCTPETIERRIRPDDEAAMRAAIAGRMPSLNGPLLDARTCMYTNTADGHFVLGPHPRYPQVAVAAGFSGHGYKFATVVGEILANLARDGATRHPIGLFSPVRFAGETGGVHHA